MVSRPESGPFLVAMAGTDHHPFQRLISWLDDWLAEHSGISALVQYGSSPAPRHADGASMFSRDELAGQMSRASVVITHGGPGCIMAARACGRVPVVVPRVASLGEHVDDHQLAFTRKLARTGRVHLVESEHALRRHLDAALRDTAAYHVPHDVAAIDQTVLRVDNVLAEVLRAPPEFVSITKLRQLVRAVGSRRSRGTG